MKRKIKKAIIGYDEKEVDAIIDQYESIIETKKKDIEYLERKVKKLEMYATLTAKETKNLQDAEYCAVDEGEQVMGK